MLDTIIDPCSSAVGAPVGIETLGLVRALSVSQGESGTVIDVTIGVTEPGCVMSVPFAATARERLTLLPNVERVNVQLDRAFDWKPEDMSATYRERLEQVREERANLVKDRQILPVTHLRRSAEKATHERLDRSPKEAI